MIEVQENKKYQLVASSGCGQAYLDMHTSKILVEGPKVSCLQQAFMVMSYKT